jgi:hypothetical protein
MAILVLICISLIFLSTSSQAASHIKYLILFHRVNQVFGMIWHTVLESISTTALYFLV